MDNNTNEEFYCHICQYKTYIKCNYIRHLNSNKHHKTINYNQINAYKIYKCECGNIYKYIQNLSRHKKKCKLEKQDNLIVYDENNINYKDMFLQILQKTDTLHNLIIEQTKIINEKDKIIQEKDKTINEIVPKIGNTNSNNNFNISLFLNEHCKDAISMDEFVKNIEISLTDLLFTKQKGLVNGISNIFIKNLSDLPEKERPIWCTDKKRKKIFIKEEEWAEDVDNTKTKQVIKDVSKVQVKNISKYTQENPDWKEKENKKEEYISIVKNTTVDINEKEEQVINKLVDTIYLDTELKKSLLL